MMDSLAGSAILEDRRGEGWVGVQCPWFPVLASPCVTLALSLNLSKPHLLQPYGREGKTVSTSQDCGEDELGTASGTGSELKTWLLLSLLKHFIYGKHSVNVTRLPLIS